MIYKISEKSNQGGVIELLMQPMQSSGPWLNVQVDQRNPSNRVVRLKTVDEKSYIVLTPFFNSHPELNAFAVESELSQFISSQNYGIALIDRKVVLMADHVFKKPTLPQRTLPAPTPKHMQGSAPKKEMIPGGAQFRKEITDKRESEDAGLMAYGSAKRARVVEMFEQMGHHFQVPIQPNAKVVPKLAEKSRLLNGSVAAQMPKEARPVSPELFKLKVDSGFSLPPIEEERSEELDFAIALSLSGAEPKDEPKFVVNEPLVQALRPAFKPSFAPLFVEKPVLEVNKEDDDLSLALALSLQDEDRQKHRPSPSPAPSPYPSPSPAPSPYPAPSFKKVSFAPSLSPAPSPYPSMPKIPAYNPEYAGLGASQNALSPRLKQSRIDVDAAYAAELARKLDEEERKFASDQRNQDAYMATLLKKDDSEQPFAIQKRLQREEQDRLLALALEAEENIYADKDSEIWRAAMIEEDERSRRLEKEDDVAIVPFLPASQTLSRANLCEAYGIDIVLLNQFENLQLPALGADVYFVLNGFVKNSRFLVDALFEGNNDIMEVYKNSVENTVLLNLLALLAGDPDNKPNTPYNKAVQFVFGPYAKKDKEVDKTGGVSLRDMLVRIYVLLCKNSEIEGKAIQETRAFKFLKEQMNDQSSRSFGGAIARMFCAYWAGVRYYYDNRVGSEKKS